MFDLVNIHVLLVSSLGWWMLLVLRFRIFCFSSLNFGRPGEIITPEAQWLELELSFASPLLLPFNYGFVLINE